MLRGNLFIKLIRMTKQEIINLTNEKYQSFINYINSLTNEDYLFRYQQKWTAENQLEHMVICSKPIAKVFSMDKLMIEQNFGLTDKGSRSYDVLLNHYYRELKEGGKAPERFVPEPKSQNQKETLIAKLTGLVKDLSAGINNFTEKELDALLIPHPLLGNLTLREMLYNAIYHVQHHHQQTIQHLRSK
jgi:hypothetical protein